MDLAGKKQNLIDVDVLPANIDRDYRPQLQLTGSIAATAQGLTTHLRLFSMKLHEGTKTLYRKMIRTDYR
jgi:thiamine pyrophosphate-dependent acetolactate synthase large subunit-like protein